MIKVENKMVVQNSISLKEKAGFERKEFLIALRDLKIGQSFMINVLDSNQRNIICVAKTLLDRKFITKKEGKDYRVGRIS